MPNAISRRSTLRSLRFCRVLPRLLPRFVPSTSTHRQHTKSKLAKRRRLAQRAKRWAVHCSPLLFLIRTRRQLRNSRGRASFAWRWAVEFSQRGNSMNFGGVSLLTVGIGAVAGLRSMTVPAVVALAAYLGWIDLSGSRLAFMGTTSAFVILTLGTLAEFIAEQLPATPTRTTAAPLT